MEQEIQQQPQQVNPLPLDNKNMRRVDIMKKLAVLVVVLLVGLSIYFLFGSKCPYEFGTNLKEWARMPCPYVIKGIVVDRVFEKPLQEVKISIGKNDGRTSAEGKFVIRTRENLDQVRKVVFLKDGYAEIERGIINPSDNQKEVDLGTEYMLPAGRIVYQNGNSIFTAKLDGADVQKIADGKLLAISSKYDKFAYKTQDSALRVMDIEKKEESKFSYSYRSEQSELERPLAMNFSLNGNLVAWIDTYKASLPDGRVSGNDQLMYFDFQQDRRDSVRRIFTPINTFRISPDGNYIAVMGTSFQGQDLFILENRLTHQILLELSTVYSYFFDQENFYYQTVSGWYTYHLKDGQTESFSTEPIWWENRSKGILNPNTKTDMVILKHDWSFKLADYQGLNEKKITELELYGNGYISDLRWSRGGNYIIYTITSNSGDASFWILDTQNGKYKKIVESKK